MTTPVPALLAEIAGWTALAAVAVVGLLGAVAIIDLVRQAAAVTGD